MPFHRLPGRPHGTARARCLPGVSLSTRRRCRRRPPRSTVPQCSFRGTHSMYLRRRRPRGHPHWLRRRAHFGNWSRTRCRRSAIPSSPAANRGVSKGAICLPHRNRHPRLHTCRPSDPHSRSTTIGSRCSTGSSHPPPSHWDPMPGSRPASWCRCPPRVGSSPPIPSRPRRTKSSDLGRRLEGTTYPPTTRCRLPRCRVHRAQSSSRSHSHCPGRRSHSTCRSSPALNSGPRRRGSTRPVPGSPSARCQHLLRLSHRVRASRHCRHSPW